MKNDVVITGMGIYSPIGCGARDFWDALLEGRTGANAVTGFDTSELTRRIACQVKEPPGSDDISCGRASRLAIAASQQALKTAKLTVTSLTSARVATIVGTTMGETEFIERRLDSPKEEWLSQEHARQIIGGSPGCISRNTAIHIGVDPDDAIDLYGACAAGNMALGMARRRLLEDRCDVAIAGGADGFSRLAFLGFMRLRVMAANVCRPFDERRDGLLVGEGGVMLVLEREASAKARGVPILARMIGAGNACEDYHPTRPHPEGDGLTRSTRAALEDAGLQPNEIDYICAHGTGTPQNDAIEVGVMNKCFPSATKFSSIKAITGHCMGAAAATEAAQCVLSLQHQTLIPTWHLDTVLQPCSLDPLQGSPRTGRVRYVLNNSAGFGGYNSSVILAVA
ncbi:MAG: beta-ketoacyl-[acyl-carrier-protein] synthase family protein [Planctomycetes bacterium]|nr:beta-ketoacyl-[acyl-carrier-protein] synthase family protein [Planctomycetota bacterium]